MAEIEDLEALEQELERLEKLSQTLEERVTGARIAVSIFRQMDANLRRRLTMLGVDPSDCLVWTDPPLSLSNGD